MFNHIRKVPYVTGDGRGGINYIVPGFQQQLGLETQIVAALCTSHPLPLDFSTRANRSRLRWCPVILRHHSRH
jgi:oligosaccharyltransferase complex subunit gamma